ncbi:alanine racemase [Halanaerobaculum tunisiense]
MHVSRIKEIRPAWTEIDLDNIGHNVSEFKKKLPEETLLTSVVKADGYGHGAIEVAKTALQSGADRLAVAILDEAIKLKKAGFEVPILVLGWTPQEAAEQVVKHNIITTVYNYENVSNLAKKAVELNKKVKVHVKVDTGMGRIGLQPDEAINFISKIKELPNLIIEGIYTHFSVADEEDKTYTYQQLNKFKKVISDLKKKGIEIPIKHCANSAAFLDIPETYFDMVRTGIITYGLWPSDEVNKELDLKPGLRLKARVAHVKEVPPGTDISYGRTYTTKKNTKIATVPLGYDDGYCRLLSSNSYVLVNGEKAPVIGNICMDQFMIDVSEVGAVKVGDEVVLIGKSGNEEITATELANRIGTINYEVVCMVSKRIPRVYIKNEKVTKVKKLI